MRAWPKEEKERRARGARMHSNLPRGPSGTALDFCASRRFAGPWQRDEEESRERETEGEEGREDTGLLLLLPTYKLYALNEIYG